MSKDELAKRLHTAWARYEALLGEPPHGTLKQLLALVELMGLPSEELPAVSSIEVRVKTMFDKVLLKLPSAEAYTAQRCIHLGRYTEAEAIMAPYLDINECL